MECIESTTQTPREGLMRLMDGFASMRLIYIHAPAGYGKTVTAQLWLEHKKKESDVKHAWIGLDDYDNRAAGFCGRFASALLGLQPKNAQLCELAGHPSFGTASEEFTAEIISAFRDDGCQYILVIDDLHTVKNYETLKLFPLFFKRLPESFTIVCLSRTEPHDIFAGLIVKNEMAIIGAESLLFTDEEIIRLFEGNGIPLTKIQAGEIFKATGGWAIGLCAMLISGRETYDTKLTSRYLETFLKDHVWERWDEQTREYLKRASVVSELMPELFNALTGAKKGADILAGIKRENGFLRLTDNGTYRFHDLFRDFLLNLLERDGASVLNAQMKKAGDWFFGQKDFYRSIHYYKSCGDDAGVAESLGFAYDLDSRHTSIEDTLAVIHLAVTDAILEKYPFLLQVLTWAVCVEGDLEKAELLLDRCYALPPDAALQEPRVILMMGSLRMMDHRLSNYDVPMDIAESPVPWDTNWNPTTPSFTFNMPFIHRCCCDFSEYAIDSANRLYYLRKAWSGVFKDKYEIIESMIRAGINYERGYLSEAHETVLTTVATINDESSIELSFSVFMLLAAVLEGQGRRNEMRKVLTETEAFIKRRGAYFLNANFRAFCCRLELSDGDIAAARGWLDENGQIPYAPVPFYMLYRYFTTVRSFIVIEDNNRAILLLKKVISLIDRCSYRPLDFIETRILLAIAYWKKGRGNQAAALGFLRQAIETAYEYQYTQAFANEGADLENMLNRLQKQAVRQDYTGNVPSAFLKSLYLSAVVASKHHKGMSGGRIPDNLKFTEQQKTVMRLLCEGYSRNETAERMGISLDGVKSHLKSIYKKLDVTSSVEAVVKIKELNVSSEIS